jgi:hypothetical protein
VEPAPMFVRPLESTNKRGHRNPKSDRGIRRPRATHRRARVAPVHRPPRDTERHQNQQDERSGRRAERIRSGHLLRELPHQRTHRLVEGRARRKTQLSVETEVESQQGPPGTESSGSWRGQGRIVVRSSTSSKDAWRISPTPSGTSGCPSRQIYPPVAARTSNPI